LDAAIHGCNPLLSHVVGSQPDAAKSLKIQLQVLKIAVSPRKLASGSLALSAIPRDRKPRKDLPQLEFHRVGRAVPGPMNESRWEKMKPGTSCLSTTMAVFVLLVRLLPR